ncbi:MAG TPA: hypothetical protein VGB13_13395, partial [Candidatus Krumholzibacteria bacterium]
MSRKPDGSKFRSWLVEKLVASRWAVYQDDTDETIAQRIGVTVDVLCEAREVFNAREAKHLRKPARLGMPRAKTRSRYMLFLEPPEEIYLDWAATCKHRDQTNACLLRSAVHHVLRLKWQPSWLVTRGPRAWYYRGQWLGQSRIREHRFRMKTDLGEPCYRALTERALATGVDASAIARWGVVDLL